MNNEAMIQQHAAEIARHAKAIQELQAPKLTVSDDLKMHAIIVTGRHRIKRAVAEVIERHERQWEIEQMYALMKSEEILSRMEPDPWASLRDMWWTNDQMDRLRRPSNAHPHNLLRAIANDEENRRLANFARRLANDTSHHGALHGPATSRYWNF